MLKRTTRRREIAEALRRHRIVALLGPRQCGKTTLARTFVGDPGNYFDLEDPLDDARLRAPRQALDERTGLVILDEIQLRPDLFPLLRVLADRPGVPARFLILGSASPGVIRGVSESLAGRVGFVDLFGFDASEVGLRNTRRLWLRGGFPPSYLARREEDSADWRRSFVRAMVTRDLPMMGMRIPAEQVRRFWLMLAHYHGQTWNASEIGGSLGINYKTAQHYLDLLTGAFLVRTLQPWSENLGKRIRRVPKVYVRDSGLFHTLQGIGTLDDLQAHPKLGASWEGFALEHVLRYLRCGPDEAFCWATHGGAELDLLVIRGARRLGFEFKYADAPTATKSMRVARSDLRLDRLCVVYPGDKDYALDDRIEAVGFPNLRARLGRP